MNFVFSDGRRRASSICGQPYETLFHWLGRFTGFLNSQRLGTLFQEANETPCEFDLSLRADSIAMLKTNASHSMSSKRREIVQSKVSDSDSFFPAPVPKVPGGGKKHVSLLFTIAFAIKRRSVLFENFAFGTPLHTSESASLFILFMKHRISFPWHLDQGATRYVVDHERLGRTGLGDIHPYTAWR